MAIRRITQLVDDLDGSVLEDGEAKRLTFSIDGRAYEMDVSSESYQKFNDAVAPFVSAARRTGTHTSSPRRRANQKALDLSAVRAWAREHGHAVSDRGRVPASLLDEYRAATS
ncbi:Lsr2 family protein [Microbacterium sp. NPDC090007]|uniref:histone-like nucleoid-structuring protein Lsr2 n=1 Tax=Microbacterium sp. NPDC090007 TaxID=3364204 RepID=UPI0038230A4D